MAVRRVTDRHGTIHDNAGTGCHGGVRVATTQPNAVKSRRGLNIRRIRAVIRHNTPYLNSENGIIQVTNETDGDKPCCGRRFASYFRISLCWCSH